MRSRQLRTARSREPVISGWWVVIASYAGMRVTRKPPAREALSVQNSITALEAVGALLRPHIAARADFLEAAHTGKGVTEVDPKGEAAQEMRDLWLAVNRLLRPFRRDKPKQVWPTSTG